MKNIIGKLNEKTKELAKFEQRRMDLDKEQRATEVKLATARSVSFNAELEEVALLRKVWTARKVGGAMQQIENEEHGVVANQCEPASWRASALDDLRAEVDAALRGIYPTPEVEKMRIKVEELRRSVKSLEILHTKRIPSEIEGIDSQIAEAKIALAELDRKVCVAAFEAVKEDIQKNAWPLVRKAFITLNLHNPYYLRWPDIRFFTMLFDEKFPISELLKERDKLRAEILKS